MSAFAGVRYFAGGPPSGEVLDALYGALAHRGPDGRRVWTDGETSLAFASLDNASRAGDGPMPLEDKQAGTVIAGDIRLDNATELARELRVDRANMSPPAVVLAAYERWGEGCAERLLGDFAFVVWDRRRRQLFCARDVFGVRPFYYSFQKGRRFTCGTELATVLGMGVAPELRERKIADYLEGNHSDQVNTFHQEILRLPAAHVAVLTDGQLRVHRYWKPDLFGELRLKSDEAYAEGYREVLEGAVRARMTGVEPLGAMLSGGLDSSSIVGVARHLLSRDAPLHTFSARFRSIPDSDEGPFIAAMTTSGSAYVPHFIAGDRQNPFDGLDLLLPRHGEPLAGPNGFIHLGLMPRAQEAGVRVVLDGFGGDSSVGHGWGRLSELASSLRWLRLAREIRAFSAAELGVEPLPLYRSLVWGTGITARAPRWLHRLKRRPASQNSGSVGFLRPEFREAVRAGAPPEAERSGPIRRERDRHCREILGGEIPLAMEIGDTMGAAHGLEYRYPFLDRRLVEYCLSLPPEQKLNNGWTRSAARRGIEGLVPPEVQWRRDKSNLGYNFQHILIANGRPHIARALFDQHALIDPYLDVPALRRALRRTEQGTGSFDDAGSLWLATVLSMWISLTGR